MKVRTLTLSEDSAEDVQDQELVSRPHSSSASSMSGNQNASNGHNVYPFFNNSATTNGNRNGGDHSRDDVLSRTGSPSIRRQLMGIIGQQPPVSLEDSQGFQPISNAHLFDPARPRYPSPNHLPHLAKLFFDNLACHFPFLDRTAIICQANEGTLSAILANCIAGLALRYVLTR